MFPSRANCVWPSMDQAIVRARTGVSSANDDVSAIRDEPVPYVAFTVPGVYCPCPNIAACESPIAARIGTPSSPEMPEHTPNDPEEDRSSGIDAKGIPKRSNSSVSHTDRLRFNKPVRDAL